jgi:hypothetical protein
MIDNNSSVRAPRAPAPAPPVEHSQFKSPPPDLTGLCFPLSRPIGSSEVEFGVILGAEGSGHWRIEFPETGQRHRAVIGDADARALALFPNEAECRRHVAFLLGAE